MGGGGLIADLVTMLVSKEWSLIYLFIYLSIYLFIYLWLCWVFISVRGLSLVVASGGHSSSRCAGLSLSRPLLLWSTGSRRAGSVIVAHGLSCSAACGIFPDQDGTRVPCIGRRILNDCATREAPFSSFLKRGNNNTYVDVVTEENYLKL